MRTLPIVLPALLLVGACDAGRESGAGTAEPATGTQAAPSPDVPVGDGKVETPGGEEATSERLPIGEYRVAGADGSDVNLPHGISVSVSADTIAVASQCVTPRWTYRYEDGRLHTELIVEPICDRGRYPAEEALAAVFGDPQTIVRTDANGIEITGGGQSVTLFSQ